MPSYTPDQLQNFWNYYVTLKAADVASLIDPQGPLYDPNFDAMLTFVYVNKLFGFADNSNYSGKGFVGNSAIFNGPILS